jgi:crotonobetainyl-CoA:carnitine CoA-transferase CaiB-like acyl-CoA transferase
MNVTKRGGPLDGIRVLELTKVWAGPYAGKQLAFLGAEVIKVESRGSLDVTRTYGVKDIDKAPGFMAVNPQKLSVQIDMKSADGLALLKDLAANCDILIENLRPGAIDRLGIGYAALRAVRPDIIFVSMGMYGNEGPLAYQTGYAPCFVALGGLSSLVGYEGEAPRGMNVRYADSTFGTAAAFAALAALNHRKRAGEGQFIDVSAVETMTSVIGDRFMEYSLNGRIPACDGNRHAEMAPHGAYPCAGDDWIAIAAQDDTAWAALAKAAGLEDNRFATLAGRKAHEAEIDAALSAWTAGQDAATLTATLQSLGVAAAKSASSMDMVADGHLWGQEFFRSVTDAHGQDRSIIGPGYRMTDAAALSDGAPRLGQHNAYVFGDILGLSAAEQQRLADTGAIR